MKIILGFNYKKNDYLVVDDKTGIFLGRYANNEFVSIPDLEKSDLRNIIKLLLVKNFSKESLLNQDVIILNTSGFRLKSGIPNAIILELQSEMKNNLIKNCSKLNSEIKLKQTKKILIILFSIIAILAVIFGIVSLVISAVKNNMAEKELLEKYTYIRDESLSDFYSMNYQVINITNKTSANMFEDTYVSFETPYYNYLSSTYYDISFITNSYSGDNELDIVYAYNTYENDFESYDFDTINQKYNISVEDVFSKNDVNNSMDLIYNIILNSQKEITSKSSEEEMINSLVFEIYRPLEIPYDQSSTTNELIFFTGDKYGYAHITDNELSIVLKNGNNEYKVIYKYSGNEVKLTNEQIVNLVSTLKFNQ